MKKILILCLCVLYLFCFGFSAASGDENSGLQQAYAAMLEEFERGNYADALIAAEIVYEGNPNYQEIVSYYNYLHALLVDLPEGRYQEASKVFDALSLRDFQKSAGYKAYTQGCRYEAEGEYSKALDQFSQAFALKVDEAYDKIQECRAKSEDEKYSRALDLQARKKYLEAANAFDDLILEYPDAREKAKECRYSAAEEYSREEKYAEAADLFAQLGDFRDSRLRAAQNQALASGLDPFNTPGPDPENPDAETASAENRIPVLSEAYPGIKAAFRPTENRWFSRFGPGTNYADGSGGFKADSGHSSWLTVFYAENDWVLAHIVYSSAFERYAYLPRYAVSLSGNLPEVSEPEYVEAATNADTTPLWGPEESFNQITECTVAADTELKVFFRENDYVFAEFTCSYGLVRMWLPLGNVSFHESQSNS